MNNGWVKLYRDLLDNPIWKCGTNEQKIILVTLLLMANHETNKWEWQGRKFEVKAGQFVTSLQSIADAAGGDITIQNVRTALRRFEKLGFLTNTSTKTGRLITIVNWEKYQDNGQRPNKDTNKDLTEHQQRPNKDLTPNKNDKNDKNDKKMMIVNNFCNKYAQLTNREISSSSIEKLNLIDQKILDQILSEIEKSTYLKNNAEINWILNNLNKIIEGKYRDYLKIENANRTNSFKNFKQHEYKEHELDEIVKRKREKLFRELNEI